MPDFPLIDAHLHVYDPASLDYPWMADVPRLNRRHMPDDFRSRLGGVEVEAVVFVEVDVAPGRALDEVDFVAGVASADPLVRAMVAAVPLDAGAATQAELAFFRRQPLARGIRNLVQGHVDEPGWCLREPFVDGVRSLAAHDLTFDICILHPQMADATELVRRCPEVTFVLDHIGKPGIKAGLSEPWRRDMAALAALPNVWCKISGAVTEADHAAWTEDEVLPYVGHAIDCFGYGRVMFGGDWPVVELASDYARWVRLVDRAASAASPADRRRLFRENAAAFYRL